MQKALFLAQELVGIPTDFEFILYKHGPYSFDFHDELTLLRADMMLDLERQPQPFGPKFITTFQSVKIEDRFPRTANKTIVAMAGQPRAGSPRAGQPSAGSHF